MVLKSQAEKSGNLLSVFFDLAPKAQIVIKAKNGKVILNVHPKFTTVSSNKTNIRRVNNLTQR